MTHLLKYLPFTIIAWAGLGAICARCVHAPMKLFAIICVISEFADTHFFLMMSKQFARNKFEKKALYILTNIIVNTITVIALNRLNLIAKQGTLFLTLLTILNFSSKVNELSYSK